MNELYNYYLYSSGPNYGAKPHFYRVDQLPKEGFSSLYAVTEATAQAIQQTGSAKGFKGVVWSPFLWLDFDDAEAAESAGSRLETLGLEFYAYSTGNRGLHFRITRDNAPSHLLPLQDKQWVRKEFPKADSSIYTHLHPFRLEGTVHQKTGIRKSLVFEHRGSPLVLPAYEEPTMSYSIPSSNGGRRKSVFDNFQLMANTVPVFNGERQYYLVRQLYALKASGVPEDKALWWIENWNKLLSEPKEQNELEKALRSIYR